MVDEAMESWGAGFNYGPSDGRRDEPSLLDGWFIPNWMGRN